MDIQTVIETLPDDGKGKRIVRQTTCCDCGATVTIKLNKNKLAYYCCGNFYDGEYCANQKKYGRVQTVKMLAEIAKGKGIDHGEPKPDYGKEKTTGKPASGGSATGTPAGTGNAQPNGIGGGFLDDFLSF